MRCNFIISRVNLNPLMKIKTFTGKADEDCIFIFGLMNELHIVVMMVLLINSKFSENSKHFIKVNGDPLCA